MKMMMQMRNPDVYEAASDSVFDVDEYMKKHKDEIVTSEEYIGEVDEVEDDEIEELEF